MELSRNQERKLRRIARDLTEYCFPIKDCSTCNLCLMSSGVAHCVVLPLVDRIEDMLEKDGGATEGQEN